jgi:hypothetical protein
VQKRRKTDRQGKQSAIHGVDATQAATSSQ